MKTTSDILTTEVQKFIEQHITADVNQLALQAHRYETLPMGFILGQIKARQKAKKKLPTWCQNYQLIFPTSLSQEQASSEETAAYKSKLVQGKTIADLTGGLGVDVLAFAEHFEHVFYVEQQEEVAQAAQHNFQSLKKPHIKVHHTSAEDFLEHYPKMDVIYLDPARRGDKGERVFGFDDCTPNVLELLPKLLEKSGQVLIKASPMIDLMEAVRQLGCVKSIHVLSSANDCKELLFLLEKNYEGEISIVATALGKGKIVSVFPEPAQQLVFSEVKNYLYLPDVAVTKAGMFQLPVGFFGVEKLHLHTHAYTSEELKPDFLGRIFKVKGIEKLDKKALKKHLSKKANVIVRNVPLTVEQVRQKLGLKDGGKDYLIVLTDASESIKAVVGELL